MSLLLDALKKAADDKQKTAQSAATVAGSSSPQSNSVALNESEVSEQSDNSIASSELESSPLDELSLQAIDSNEDNADGLTIDDADADLELTLDVDTSETGPAVAESADANEVGLAEAGAEQKTDQENDMAETFSQRQSRKSNDQDKNRFTVSDDALSMLIQNTNRDVKHSKRILLASVIMISIAILISGGVYYYMDMQAEIAALERKHQIAMQAMRSKTSKEKSPKQSEIIRSLVSEADVDEKIQYAKQHLASEAKPRQVKKKPGAASEISAASAQYSSAEFSIKKTNTKDPVGEGLNAAWQAYESGQYAEAKKAYKKILAIEENNRDALLGMGAIALVEKNDSMAREIYLSLLQQDPRDPIATAALASLRNDEASLDAEEQYLIELLQKNPQAPHLNFALANIYAQQNKWKSAQKYYFNAWQQDVDNADYIFNLAISMDQLNKPQQALNFYQDSLLKSENKQVSFSRASVQKRINELTEL